MDISNLTVYNIYKGNLVFSNNTRQSLCASKLGSGQVTINSWFVLLGHNWILILTDFFFLTIKLNHMCYNKPKSQAVILLNRVIL